MDELQAKVKHLSIVDYAEGMQLLIKAKEKMARSEIPEAEHFLRKSVDKLKTASLSDPNNYMNVLQYP